MSNEMAEVVSENETPEVAEQAPADVAVDDAPKTEPEEKPTRFQKRIDELVGQRHALQEDRDYWRAKALELEKRPEPEAPKPEAKKKPTMADFDHDVEAYSEALTEWVESRVTEATEAKARELQEQQSKKAQEQESQSQQKAIQQAFQEKSEEFAADHPDYYAVISNPTLPISQEMTSIILEMDNGPQVAYHLANNPDVAYKISQKSPTQIAVALASLKLDKPEASPTTSAPEPPKPIAGSSASNVKADPRDPRSDKLTTKDWASARLKQLRKDNG